MKSVTGKATSQSLCPKQRIGRECKEAGRATPRKWRCAHGGSQAVRLPKAFRFEDTEVLIERRGNEVVLKPAPVPRFATFKDVALYLAAKFPRSGDFPDVEPPAAHDERDLSW